MKGPLHRYRALVSSGALSFDAAQEAVAVRLQALSEALTAPRRWRLFGARPTPARGVYLWGGVGAGKSLLMDIFFNNTKIERRRRVHFHEFMEETHDRIGAWRAAPESRRRAHPGHNPKAPDDPIPLVARDIADAARLLCFDEFQVSDIADAMILGRLFAGLFGAGVVVVATSNRHPDALYADGLNRQLFLPAIALIKEKMEVIALNAARDYRLARLTGAAVWHSPLGAAAARAMDEGWQAIICGARDQPDTIPIRGRTLGIARAARGAARDSFANVCASALGPSDYLAIARRYHTVFLDDIPLMGPENRNEAKRFVTLIDALYEARTKLVASAADAPDRLYVSGDGAFEFQRTASRLIEMQSADYMGAEHRSAS